MNRRNFIKTSSLAGGGLLLSMHLPASKAMAQQNTAFAPNVFIKITNDNFVHVSLTNPEIGQGIHTTIAMLLAEELGADWNRLKFVQTDYARHFGGQKAGGSGGTQSLWLPMRKAGATAREMLVQAAAGQWKVKPENCSVKNSFVVHPKGQKKLSFGKLATQAARLETPDKPRLKSADKFDIIGSPKANIRTKDIVTGKALFGINTKIPGMVYAASLRSPVYRATLKNYDDKATRAIKGVLDVIEIKDPGGFYIPGQVVVVATSTWAAFKGKTALKVNWNESNKTQETSENIRQRYQKAAARDGVISYEKGNTQAVLAKTDNVLTATYENAYQAHASMEPLSCVVKIENDTCEVWAPTQHPRWALGKIAKAAGVSAKNVTIHMIPSGGAFGRRLTPDFVVEAVMVAKKTGKPVKMTWSREDDIQNDFYHPYQHHVHSLALDKNNKPVAWNYKIISPFHSATFNPRFKGPLTERSLKRVYVPANPYSVPNLRNEYVMQNNNLPTGWWRSVDFHGWAFSIESFVDEAAHKLGKDSYKFRMELLDNPQALKFPRTNEKLDQQRQRKVLELAAKKAQWGKTLPKGSAQGIACCPYFHCDTYAAQVVELSVDKNGALTIDKVACVVDCGTVVNPNIAKQQIEGGIIFGLSALLYGEITLENGRVKQSNFHDYQMLRLKDTPEIEVHFIEGNGRPPGGTGEPGVPAIAPAVLNAIFKATGKRIRQIPVLNQLTVNN